MLAPSLMRGRPVCCAIVLLLFAWVFQVRDRVCVAVFYDGWGIGLLCVDFGFLLGLGLVRSLSMEARNM